MSQPTGIRVSQAVIALEQALALIVDERICPEAKDIIGHALTKGPRRLPPWDHVAAENRSAERRAALHRMAALAEASCATTK